MFLSDMIFLEGDLCAAVEGSLDMPSSLFSEFLLDMMFLRGDLGIFFSVEDYLFMPSSFYVFLLSMIGFL